MPPSVLVVDDQPTAAEPVAALFRQLGYDVRVATTAADALAALSGWPPDAAILDATMPDRAGLAVAEALAGRSRRPVLIALLRPGAARHLSSTKRPLFDYAYTKAVSPAVLAGRVADYLAMRTERPGG